MNRYLRDGSGQWYEGYVTATPDDGSEWADRVAVILGLPAGSLTVVDADVDPRTGETIKEPVVVEPKAQPSLAELVTDLAQALIDSPSIDGATKGALVIALGREKEFSVVQTEGVGR